MDQTRTTVAIALGPYGLDPIEIEEQASSNNDVYRVLTQDGPVVLRLHRRGARRPQEIASEIAFLEHIAQDGRLTAPVPLRTTDGESTTTVATSHGDRTVSVLRWIDGTSKRPGAGAGPATLHRIGVIHATLHDIAAVYTPGPDSQPANLAPSIHVIPHLRFVTDAGHRTLMEQTIGHTENLFAAVPMTQQHRGMIHYDVVFGNIIHRGRTTALVDFDDCGWGTYLQDLGPTLENIASSPRPEQLRTAYLEGYASVRVLPSSEPFVLDAMIALRQAWACAWSYGRAAAGDFSPDRLDAIVGYRMGWLAEFLGVSR